MIPLLLAALALVTHLLSGCGGEESPPNLILITIDTCRADRIGCYGATVCETPAIDVIGEAGVVFENVMATAPMTLPSHASILTGLYPHRHTLRDNGAARLPGEAETLAEVLSAAGWATGGFVAAVPLEGRYGTDQGFDLYDDEFLDEAIEGNVLSRLHTDQRTGDRIVDLAGAWIRETGRADAPFFAWLHFFDPHSPYEPPPTQAARYGQASYEGEIAFVDEQIGRLLEGLGDARDRTVIALTADHGESLGEHGESSHGFFVYDAALRVPWVVSGPGVPAGKRVATVVSQVQIMPTLLELLGVPAPDGIDGKSVWGEVIGGAPDPAPLFAEALFPRLNFDWAGSRCIRLGRWKYIDAPTPELYDMESDPDELHNVADSERELAANLRAELLTHYARGGALTATGLEIDADTRAQLDALGYVGGESADAAATEAELWDRPGRDAKETISIFDDVKVLPTVIMSGERSEARVFVDDLIRRDPENLSLMRRIARLQIQAGDWQAAETMFGRIVNLDPEDAHAWTLLGDAARERADTTRALDAYGRAIALDPGSPAAVNGKALLLSHSGRPEEATRLLRSALSSDGENIETLNNLAWILADEAIDPVEAVRHATRAAELAPDDPAVLDTLGWAAIRAGQPERAIEPLLKAWRQTQDPEVRAHLGVALAESGREDEGRRHVGAALEARAELSELPEVAKWR